MSFNHYDVLVIGAGLSGIGTACHIAKACPEKRLAILERRKNMGGTWDLFRYPGIRSDSDMFSFGYAFRPWNALKVLADGASIRKYIQATAEEFGVANKVRYGVKVVSADWSTEFKRWKVVALDEASGQSHEYTCSWLIGCTGYYNHDVGFKPEFPGEERFKGIKIHPQFWPESLDYSGKKVVVIGSGATAVTLVPSMASRAGHITMLQRSPSYIYSVPAFDQLTARLAKVLPSDWAYSLARRRNIWVYRSVYVACCRWPKLMRRFLLSHVRKHVGPDVDMRHFTPNYMPWDERLCAVPGADLFKALREGKASIETDHIHSFTENGILLKSGKKLDADIIVTATGLRMQMLGGMSLSVDGRPRSIGKSVTYKGVLIEGLPNFSWMFGYINAPWTLKMDIAADYLCRLFRYMDERRLAVVVPRDNSGNGLNESILDSLKSGYVKRDATLLPRQGKASPWRVLMDYKRDKKMLLVDSIDDTCLHFTPANARAPVSKRTGRVAA